MTPDQYMTPYEYFTSKGFPSEMVVRHIQAQKVKEIEWEEMIVNLTNKELEEKYNWKT